MLQLSLKVIKFYFVYNFIVIIKELFILPFHVKDYVS